MEIITYLFIHTFGSKVCDTCWINIDTFHLKCKVNRRVAEIDKSIILFKKIKIKSFFQICQVGGLAIMDTRGMNQIWLEVRHEN